MTLDLWTQTLAAPAPPEQAAPLLKALWWDAKGDWARAHEITQDISTADAAWVHAYLHRKEGDQWNANYWYRQARRPEATGTLEQEWSQICESLLLEA